MTDQQYTAKAIREEFKRRSELEFGQELDLILWRKAWAKYKRFCNQYSYLESFTAEMEMDKAFNSFSCFYHESKDSVQNTENRARYQNMRQQ